MLSCDVGDVHGEKRQKKGISVTIGNGITAPDFALPDADGETVKLSALKGHPVVVYFYPKDDTSGCTAEAKDFTCLAGDFAKAHVRLLIGISPDSPASHRKFQEKHDLDDSSAVGRRHGRRPRPTACGWRSRCTAASTWVSSARHS